MANYLAWHGKKRQRLKKRENRFESLLQTEKDPSKLAKAADEIRAAHVRVLKSRLAELSPSEKNAIAMENLNREIALWLALPTQEIIERYRTGRRGGGLFRRIR